MALALKPFLSFTATVWVTKEVALLSTVAE